MELLGWAKFYSECVQKIAEILKDTGFGWELIHLGIDPVDLEVTVSGYRPGTGHTECLP